MSMHHIAVRMAETDDVDAIYDLLRPFAEARIILPRSHDDLYQHLQEIVVAEYDGKLVGTTALHIYGSNLAEIRSLVVQPDYQKRQIGRLMIEAAEQWAAGLGVARIFALTYVPDFFAKLGYRQVPKETLPHKVWTVCVHCAKFADCDEIAVEKRLSDAPIEPMRLIPIIEVSQPD
ncbi:MAG TPA: N-acetyltransferase [Mariprofundaceae bacterium]|nr:N-acetyltransferase [Mariprofundaceae bacterium]